MNKTEDAEEETLPGDEDSSSTGRYLKNQAISVARQFLCSCSVIFPGLSILRELPMYYPPPFLHIRNGSRLSNVATVNANFRAHLADITVMETIGILMAVIILYLIGRKYTVIIANILQLASLLYLYATGVKEIIPPKPLIIFSGIHDFCYVTCFIYLAEITSPDFRAFLMGLYFVSDALYYKLTFHARKEKRLNRMLLNYSIVAGLSLLVSVIIPETPFWSAVKGNAEKAEETFTWLRAGNTNRIEFNQMIASAENIRDNRRPIKPLLSRTFAVGLIFSICIVICTFNPFHVLQPFIHDFYQTLDETIGAKVFYELRDLLKMDKAREYQYRIYGSLIFLLFSSVVPRKIMYFVSYVFGVLIVAVVGLKLGHYSLLTELVSYCGLAPRLGVLPMSIILPVEIYPASVREAGVAITIILIGVYRYISQFSFTVPRKLFPKAGLLREMHFFTYFASFFAIVFILTFMPETWRMNIYELKELNLNLPWKRHKKGEGAEDAEDENASTVEEWEES